MRAAAPGHHDEGQEQRPAAVAQHPVNRSRLGLRVEHLQRTAQRGDEVPARSDRDLVEAQPRGQEAELDGRGTI